MQPSIYQICLCQLVIQNLLFHLILLHLEFDVKDLNNIYKWNLLLTTMYQPFGFLKKIHISLAKGCQRRRGLGNFYIIEYYFKDIKMIKCARQTYWAELLCYSLKCASSICLAHLTWWILHKWITGLFKNGEKFSFPIF